MGIQTEKLQCKFVNTWTTTPNLMKAVNKFYVFDNIIYLKYEAMQISIFGTYFAQMSLNFFVDPLLIDQHKGREKL